MEATTNPKRMDGWLIVAVIAAIFAIGLLITPAGSPQRTARATAQTSLESLIGPNELLRVERDRANALRAELQEYSAQGIPEAGIAAMRVRCEHLKARITEVRGNLHWSESDRAAVLEPLKEELVHYEAALFRLR